MRKLSKKAKKVFGKLIDRLEESDEDSLTIDKGGEAIMALHVERIRPDIPVYSFAHYYEQNHDLVADPDIVLYKQEREDSDSYELYPVSIQQPFPPGVKSVLKFDEEGKPSKYSKKGQKKIAVFCTKWAENLKEQQGL